MHLVNGLLHDQQSGITCVDLASTINYIEIPIKMQ